jgi:hypothetical protein
VLEIQTKRQDTFLEHLITFRRLAVRKEAEFILF